ncbi:Nicotinate-nucleotide adenylyltransferase [Candidatus Providencia siddallii]|uniref:Probable nicotinate-nucleotide adenylyltransferase n=1 Tax=Candidatus Providencia siddallii TaxID=1715285 RepID=A0ABM9NND9_9GAMM
MKNILHTFFGGTFDPIHYGHIRPLENLAKQIGLNKINLLPNNITPNHKKPYANYKQRIEMINLAIKNRPLFKINLYEKKKITSYTIDTLINLRKKIGIKQPIIFIIGEDLLFSINTWKKWDKILNNCHLLVYPRNCYKKINNLKIKNWLFKNLINDNKRLKYFPNGYIFLAKTPLENISSTEIRQKIFLNKSCDSLTPKTVIQYIKQQNLYQKIY